MQCVPYFDYSKAFAQYEEQIIDITRDVLRRGAFIQQRDLAQFEKNLANFLGVKHAIGVANCTDGLVMLARAAGIGPGDEVIFPSHTMVATAASVAHVGAIPVPVDSGADHLLYPCSVESAISERTKAIMPVHLNGRTCDMSELTAIAERHGLLIIEDAAQALGSKFNGRFAGTFGVGGAISFYPAKVLGCLGDGGAVITNDDGVAERINWLRDHGRDACGEVMEWGFNSRLDNLQAAILDVMLNDYAAVVSYRRKLAGLYHHELSSQSALLLPPAPDSDPAHFDVYQNYEIEADRRDDLRSFLKSRNIGTLLPWGGKAVHQFSRLSLGRILPQTDLMFKRCLMLPMNTMIGEADVHYICNAIREFYAG